MTRGPLSRRVRLTPALVAINAGLVLFAVACLVGVATVVLRGLGDQQALARLELAGAAALDQVDRTQDELVTSARLLAESSIAAESRGASISAADLDRFSAAGDLDGCALQSSGHAFARSAAELPWPAIEATVDAAPDAAPSIELLAEPEIFLVASAPARGAGRIRAVAVKRLDQALVRSLGERYDLLVTVLPVRGLPRAGAEESALRANALATGHAARRLEDLETYRDIRVLRAATGPPVALVETSLPTATVDGSLDALARRLLLFAALVTLLVVALSAALGRLVTRPLGGMAVAAERIGAGDFNMPIPDAASVELGSLAATMDRMRQQLRRLTSELERREAEAQALLGGIVEGVFAVDGDRRIRYLNPQTAQLLRIDPEAALGRFCGDVLDPQGVDGVRPCAESCPIVHARSRGASLATERLRLRDGAVLTTVITSAPPVDGRQVQVLRDETDVEAARRLRDAILANVSHEFKTPLSAQLASIELLRDSLGELEPDAARQLVQSLERGTLRLQQLIDNLLESVRIEAGRPGLRSAPLSIEAVIDAAAELTGPLLAQRAQRLVVDLPAALPELVGDPPRLTQVFVNLLANANKFAPAGSEIRVGAERRDDQVVLWVEDAGSGLPLGAGGSIFERFVRAPQEPLQSGMGLGLWIVKSIVEAHGGRVDARNVASGGARFSVTLPLVYRHAGGFGHGRERVKILVVDDDLDLLALIAFALRQDGYFVIEATDGELALQRFGQEAPDLVVLDGNLPKLDGFEVCRRLRADSRVPILMLTVRGDEADVVRGLDLGADDYLTKPFSPRTLLARIRALLRRSGLEKSGEISQGSIALDVARHEVAVGGDAAVRLTKLEFRLLQLLLAHAGQAIEAERLLQHVWGQRAAGDRQLLKQLVHRLRQKIEQDPSSPRHLLTVPGVGYELDTEGRDHAAAQE